MARFRRRNYFIRKGFQGRFILRFLILSIAGIIMAIGLFNLLAYRKIDSILYSMTIPALSTGRLFIREALFANVVAVLFVVAMFVITARGIFNRISDPLSLIRARIQKLGRGELGCRIDMRKGDEFKEFAEEINSMAESLNLQFSRIHESVQLLSETVDELGKGGGEVGGEIKEKLMPRIETLEKQLRAFRK